MAFYGMSAVPLLLSHYLFVDCLVKMQLHFQLIIFIHFYFLFLSIDHANGLYYLDLFYACISLLGIMSLV